MNITHDQEPIKHEDTILISVIEQIKERVELCR